MAICYAGECRIDTRVLQTLACVIYSHLTGMALPLKAKLPQFNVSCGNSRTKTAIVVALVAPTFF